MNTLFEVGKVGRNLFCCIMFLVISNPYRNA